MFLRPLLFLLPFLVLSVFGQEDKKSNPVDVLQVKHLLIEHYNGSLSYDNLEFFHNVEDLHLSSSNFTPFNQSFLLALPNLKRLLMSRNVLKPVDYDISGCCAKVQELELSHHGQEDEDLLPVELKMIKSMKSLRNLVLQSKKFSTLTEGTISSSDLINMTIIGCHLVTIEDNALNKLNKLENLDLRFNMIVDIKKEALAPLKNVRVINLRGNLLEKLTTDQIPPLPNLETVTVAYNPIMQLNLEGIKQIAPKLKAVDITGTAIEQTESGGVQLIKRTVVRV